MGWPDVVQVDLMSQASHIKVGPLKLQLSLS